MLFELVMSKKDDLIVIRKLSLINFNSFKLTWIRSEIQCSIELGQ